MIGLILRSLSFYWRPNLGVLAGTVLAAAVLTGALLVGDSVDHSLRTFALQRLGGIHYAMDTRTQFVDEGLAQRLAEALPASASTALKLRGMAIYLGANPSERGQVNQVEVYGVDDAFWTFGNGDPLGLGPFETALNEKLATALGVEAGDEISLRVAQPALMARDSPLSWRDEERSRRARYTVKRIAADDAMGRFGLTPSQVPPYNAFVNREFLQQQVDLEDRANLILTGDVANETLTNALESVWRPSDIGLEFREHPNGVVQLESDRVFLSDETVRTALELPNAHGTLTYLATALSKGDALTPYFFIVAGPVPEDMRDDEIVINRWVAGEIDTNAGDTVTLTYAELLPNNDFVERERVFTVHSIREMADLQTERELMPNFPGMSDVESCSEWDVGMPMDEELLNDEANEAYWDEYRDTPKAFVTLAAGQDMFANRFGKLTAVRFTGGLPAPDLAEQFRANVNPELAGLFFLPVREQAMAAVNQAMDFGQLFLGMSFFLIAAALLLTGLLFVFNVQQRATQIGTFMAVGFEKRTVRRLILGEGFVVALVGAILGAGLGTLYTRALIYGLGKYWGGAVANAAILYHAKPMTFVIGAVATLVCAMLTMFLATRKLTRKSARELHQGEAAEEFAPRRVKTPGRIGLAASLVALVASVALVGVSLAMETANVASIFFGAGALLLMAGIGFLRYALLKLNTESSEAAFTLPRLSVLDLARRPGRNLAVAALLAAGCFLVFAVSSMQEDLTAHADQRSSGTGGFELVADSTFAVLEDPAAAIVAEDVFVSRVKVRDGDDASCLNLNQAQTPRVLGVNIDDLIARDAFTQAGNGAELWESIRGTLPNGHVPALVGDSNTAMWTLKKGAGDVLIYQDETGYEAPIELVGQLPMRLSVFQGSIVVSQENFTRLFPSEDGYRMFLIDAPEERVSDVAAALGRAFDRFGFDAVPAGQRLMEYYAVEATYLAMFLVLGGLGLAVGTIGMSVVILRNLVERRNETAMLEALGFREHTIYRLAFAGYGVLVAAGLAIGGIAAFLAAVPALFAAESTVAIGTQIRIATIVIAATVGFMALAISAGLRKVEFAALRNE